MRSTVTKRSAKVAKKAARDRRTVTERRRASAATRKGWATRRRKAAKAKLGERLLKAHLDPNVDARTATDHEQHLAKHREAVGGAGAIEFGGKVTKPELVTISKRLERIEHDLGELARRDLPLTDPSRITGMGLVDPAAQIKSAARATMTAPPELKAPERERQVPFIGFSIERTSACLLHLDTQLDRLAKFLVVLYGEAAGAAIGPPRGPALPTPENTAQAAINMADLADSVSTRLTVIANLLPEAP